MRCALGVLLAGLTRSAAELQMAFGVSLVVDVAEAAVAGATVAVTVDARRDRILGPHVVALGVLAFDVCPVPRTIGLFHCPSPSVGVAAIETC
jgi:hypothetical protein